MESVRLDQLESERNAVVSSQEVAEDAHSQAPRRFALLERWDRTIHGSLSHLDAIVIRKHVAQLQYLVYAFLNTHRRDEAARILKAAGCGLPGDATADDICDPAAWSSYVHDDVNGCRWGLDQFVGLIESNTSELPTS